VLASSLGLNGTTAYGEAPNSADLNVSNWTFELWFRDDNPGYNHARTRILTKGDATSAEVPFFASIGECSYRRLPRWQRRFHRYLQLELWGRDR